MLVARHAGAAPTCRRMTRVEVSVPRTPAYRWDPHISAALYFGAAAIVVLLGLFLAWSALAPLHSAVVGDGRLIAEGDRRAVQAPGPGIVSAILVGDGDLVEPGQTLVRMDPAAQKALWQERLGSYYGVLLEVHRLRAEAAGLEGLDPPAFLADPDLPAAVGAIFAEQQSLFERRKIAHRLSLAENEQEVARLAAGLDRERTRRVSKNRQAALVEDELVGLRELYAKGLTPRSRVLELERLRLALLSDRDEAAASIQELQKQIEVQELAVERLKAEREKEIANRLTDLTQQAEALREALVEAQSALTRTTLVAPLRGRVMNLAVSIEGAVVASGDTLLEVVPADEGLVAEALVPARDADQLALGQRVVLRVLSQPAHEAERLEGVLTYVDADAQSVDGAPDQMRIQASFAAREGLAQRLRAGLPVSVFVETQPRSLLSYLLSPLLDFVARSLRED